MLPPIFGLVLAGGASKRMQRDKAALQYHGRPQLQWAHELLSQVCTATFISVRPDQRTESTRAGLPQIVDRQADLGPIAGICAALIEHPKVAWLVVACDLPFLTQQTLEHLIAQRDPQRIATAYRSTHDGLPEPLCAIWEPAARAALDAHLANGKVCPRKLLINSNVKLLDLPTPDALDNVNTSAEFATATQAFKGEGHGARGMGQNHLPTHNSQLTTHNSVSVRVQYFAVLREQAGRSEEMLDTTAATAAELFTELQRRYPFQLTPAQLKVAINAEFSDWHTPLHSGDTIVFIPPVAGG
jgi:molybdopterin-guanine dinucleotide biosynthesis protein A